MSRHRSFVPATQAAAPAPPRRPKAGHVLQAACIAVVVASASVALGQDPNIFITDGSTVSIPTLPYPAGTYDKLFMSNTSTLNVNAPITLTNLADVQSSSVLNVSADVTLASGINVVDGSLVLNSGTFGGAAAIIDLSNATFQRTGGRYVTERLSVLSGSANFVAGDSIVNTLALVNANVSIESNLTLSGSNFGESLYVSGSTSTIHRTNGALITSKGAWATDDGVITTDPGDDYTDAFMLMSSRGSIVNTGSESLRWIAVSGTGASFTTTAPITVSGSFPFTGLSIEVYGGGSFNANADVTAGSLLIDDVSQFVTGTSVGVLQLQSLSIAATSELALGNFGGADAQVSGWGLKVDSNVQSTLLGYISGGQIVSLSGVPMTAIYDATSNASYVVSVPEPTTITMALAGIACGGFSMWRRRKRDRVGVDI